jgi:hypothetical protein
MSRGSEDVKAVQISFEFKVRLSDKGIDLRKMEL